MMPPQEEHDESLIGSDPPNQTVTSDENITTDDVEETNSDCNIFAEQNDGNIDDAHVPSSAPLLTGIQNEEIAGTPAVQQILKAVIIIARLGIMKSDFQSQLQKVMHSCLSARTTKAAIASTLINAVVSEARENILILTDTTALMMMSLLR